MGLTKNKLGESQMSAENNKAIVRQLREEVWNQNDSCLSGNPYENFMGRWSILVARSFIHWLKPDPACSRLAAGVVL